MGKVVILMGSKRDADFCRRIAKHLQALGLDYEFRVASAHKTPKQALDILSHYEEEEIVYITVAGRSNALSAFVDGNTTKPVIACPPISEHFWGSDIHSSLRVPSGIGSLVNVEPEGAAIGAAKILALNNPKLKEIISNYQMASKMKIRRSDKSMRKPET